LKIDHSYFKKSIKNVQHLRHEETENHHTISFVTHTIMGNPSVVLLLSKKKEYEQLLDDFKITLKDYRTEGTKVVLQWRKKEIPNGQRI
jgi:hypothetical protein